MAKAKKGSGGKKDAAKKKVLFVCTANSARSQMAEGLLREMYGDRFDVFSAGVAPSPVSPWAIKVLEEVGIDISSQKSKAVSKFENESFDHVMTLCDNAKEICPAFSNARFVMHHGFPDPYYAKDRLEAFRKLREDIRSFLIGAFGE